MTTLNAIGFTTAGSAVVAVFAFSFFSVAVRLRDPKVAPRCSARSPDTIFNPKARRKPRRKGSFCFWNRRGGDGRNKKADEDKRDPEGAGGDGNDNDEEVEDDYIAKYVQHRGGPMFGWIPWVMSLSYEQLLKGVPGTGTRKNGMEGSMLKVNLDGIVMLRFHAICLRMAFLGTILALAVVLPINLTANCRLNENGIHTCIPTSNLTNFEMTTIENIPALEITDQVNAGWWVSIFGASFKIFGSNYGSFLGRLYAIALVSWTLILYCLHILGKEWVDALALRRIFYLEGSHWENRIDELNDTILKVDDMDESDDEEDMKPGAMQRRRLINKGGKAKEKKKKKKKKSFVRPPWIPHPEQRDTVPNIELYSVLVGQIPAVPSEVANEQKQNEGDSKVDQIDSLDWQLRVTTTFFDQCVPNQPGFSSSIAAITMLPDAPKLAKAWKAWYRHCALLRRLRYVRKLIAEKRHYDINECMDQDEVKQSDLESKGVAFLEDRFGKDEDDEQALPPLGGPSYQDHLDDDHDDAIGLSERENDEYELIRRRIGYFQNVLGVEFDDYVEQYDDDIPQGEQSKKIKDTLFSQILNYGPEQTAVYAREFALGSGACCPNGCREEKLRESYNLIALEEVQGLLQTQVDESFERLKEIQHANMDRQGIATSKDESAHIKEDRGTENDMEVQLFNYSITPSKYSTSGPTTSASCENSVLLSSQDGSHPVDPQGGNGFSQGGNGFVSYSNGHAVPNGQPNHHLMHPSLHSDTRESPASSMQGSFQPQMTVNNQGKIYFKDYLGSGNAGVDEISLQTPKGNKQGMEIDPNLPGPGPTLTTRRRLDTAQSQMTFQLTEENRVTEWEKVQQAVRDNNAAGNRISSGAWKIPSCRHVLRRLWHKARFPFEKTLDAVDELKSRTTFAVVTFTSRQAAVAARHCLSDGRGVGRWIPVEDIPVPPLADAAVCNICDCRGCCRPVTMTIHPKQQSLRRYITYLLLICIFVFYTVPLTFASAFVAPEKLENLFPGITQASEDSIFLSNLLSGILPAFFYSVFFALCPIMFKSLSNFGSNAVSVNQAEYNALQYYWWFMLFTAFSGTSLTTMALNYFNERTDDNATLTSLLLSIASTLPTQVSATWLNWIIFRTFCTLPLTYMVQIHTFIFQAIGWKCCIRCVMGGGAGGPMPYRIYIDSGVVFLCLICLSPVSPLIAPAALFYYLYCAPLWRRNSIYMYRPFFDTGGLRWPFLSDMLLSSIVVAQVLLTTMMVLKRAIGPAILSGLAIIPVYLHRRSTLKRFLRAYMDAALLQTSQLDGWDNAVPTSVHKREEYRKFLVDAHKAAYIPICLAGQQTMAMTNEPAVVVTHPNDTLIPIPLSHPPEDYEHPEHENATQISAMTGRSANMMRASPIYGQHLFQQSQFQPGASMRRINNPNSFNEESSSSLSGRYHPYMIPPIIPH